MRLGDSFNYPSSLSHNGGVGISWKIFVESWSGISWRIPWKSQILGRGLGPWNSRRRGKSWKNHRGKNFFKTALDPLAIRTSKLIGWNRGIPLAYFVFYKKKNIPTPHAEIAAACALQFELGIRGRLERERKK